MITLRRSAERGYADHGWLQSFHSFSFADYHDPAHMGVGNLRVINEDRIAAGTGFGTHGHRDMEIVTYVLDGALAHRDDMSRRDAPKASSGALQREATPVSSRDPASTAAEVILPGDVQRMSAGTGVRHSEFNHSKEHSTHLLQIWLLPSEHGITPSYEQKHFDAAGKRGRLRLVAAPDGRDGAITLNADAAIRAGLIDGAESSETDLPAGRIAYVHVVRGDVQVNGQTLHAGDAARLDNEPRLVLSQGKDAEVLVFDLAG